MNALAENIIYTSGWRCIGSERAVRQTIDNFCSGSIQELVRGMVEAKVLTKAELERLEEFVRDRKQGGR